MPMSDFTLNSADRKALGAFYTPDNLAETLAHWVVRTPDDRILEPSAGAGALVSAVVRVPLASGSNRVQVVACDIDPRAIDSLNRLCRGGIKTRLTDFLDLLPNSEAPFDAVIANPPFTRNHALARQRAAELRQRFGVSGAAGLWVYFILHAMQFLRPGGRLGVIVPASVTFTNYGAELISKLLGCFSEVGLYKLNDRPNWEGGANENGAIILAEGFGSCSKSSLQKGEVFRDGSIAKTKDRRKNPTGAYERILKESIPLAAAAEISIGVVTGRNKLFLLDELDRLTHGIDARDVVPVVSKAQQMQKSSITTSDLQVLAKAGHRTWLLSPRGPRSVAAMRYLEQISPGDVQEVSWLRRRDPWWQIDLGARCDAVFTYMNDMGPRISLVDPGIVCTNTLHRLTFPVRTSRVAKLRTIVSLMSTFGQLSAERIGRSYGGGVLKFEIADARRLPVIAHGYHVSAELLAQLDASMRANDLDSIRLLADKCILPNIFGPGWQRASKWMQIELDELRNRRIARLNREVA